MMTDDERWPDGWETHLCPNALDEQGNMKLATHSIHFHQEAKQLKEITDEELAEMEAQHWKTDIAFPSVGACFRCVTQWPCRTSRLIAALRAKDEELNAIRSELNWLKEHWIPSETPKG